jgi:hypothetical protein
MATQLRPIAVHVTEPEPGTFQWVLAELADNRTWSPLQAAEAHHATYREAMADGLLALQALAADLDQGPRMPAAHRRAKAAPARGDVPAGKDAAGKAQRSAFGFGLAN